MPDEAASRSRPRSIVVVGDLVEGWPPHDLSPNDLTARAAADIAADAAATENDAWSREDVAVVGGYLERLPLACVRAGLVDRAEIWHHARSDDVPAPRREAPWLTRRVFRLDEDRAPFPSAHMLAHVERFGAPEILVVLGLGVDERLLKACKGSVRIYNSIDAPSLRVPPEVSRHFDLVLTGAEWQSEEVRALHPGMPCAVMPIGPEFADPETFRPLGHPKRYDVVYVAAAQPYKRHDLLFDALANAPRRLSALCVCGYGEMGEALRREAGERGLDVTFVGPPGVPFAEVNALMNEARIGIVCGVDDGAPAILTEYMLAGLPVLANERLACGLQYIQPETGRAAPATRFGEVLVEMLDEPGATDPRQAVLDRWAWPHTVGRLAAAIEPLRAVVASRNRT
ncbi:glycosyltransferase family 4 protein [Aureimonas pseudogalii]|uniref:Glycosyltransferase involved in cell wall biosynthesis n=1 Tax=Aureimonas pseudogalii TaxID=1744844 RepID=A0A7W6ML37_9HYPH|nr:glycosyltransferase family 4 protein [Aureimonas pseudogalii]MBB3999400.1 glycosyltransferase involved in cell wall biosynthesis [Aureimonas pseudogalii]